MSDKIEEGDQFTVNDISSTSMEVTENKVYTCTKVDRGCVYFLDDSDSKDYHAEHWFTKVPKTDYQVGDLVTLSDTGKCYTTHSKAAEWGLTNYVMAESPHTDRPHTITGIFKYGGIIYSLEDEQGNQYLSGSKYFDHVFKEPKSMGADDLIGKRFISKGHLVEIQDPAYDHYKVHMYYVNSPEKSWDVSIRSIRSWIAEGVLEPVEESVPVPAELPENTQWQSYDPYKEEYDCKQTEPVKFNSKEKNEMSKINVINIEVPTTAYAETTVVTMYGSKVDPTNEEGLHSLLGRINREQDELKAVNKTAKSSRITGQINKLGAARTKVVEMLDALPEE